MERNQMEWKSSRGRNAGCRGVVGGAGAGAGGAGGAGRAGGAFILKYL